MNDYLIVLIDIPTDQEARFITLMTALMPTFTTPVPTDRHGNLTFGWTLVAAMKNAANGTTRVTHLWQVDPVQLWMQDIMGELSTIEDYVELDSLVEREEQNYVMSDHWYPMADATLWEDVGAIETLQVTGDPAKLNILEWGDSFGSDLGLKELASAAQKVGWTLLAQMTPETGLLRQFVHFWKIAGSDGGTATLDMDGFRQWLLNRDEYKAAVLSTSFSAVTPVQYGSQAAAAN
jgi:hypothetical protein